MKKKSKKVLNYLAVFIALCFISVFVKPVFSAMTDYCSIPPFITSNAPPLIMLVMGKDHKMFYEAYNDASDLNGDGRLDISYDHSIDYYGYFEINKCYTYDGSKFNPVSNNTDKFCNAGQWSGNLLNWLTMARMDVLRKVLYGGYRSTDTAATTILARTYIPQDAHSWGKEVTGRLCYNGSAYSNSCIHDANCTAGSTCVDKSNNLIGMNAPDRTSVCQVLNPVPWTKTGQMLVSRYSHASAKSCNLADHAAMINSFEPQNYIDHFYANDFNDSELDPNSDHKGSNINIFVNTEFEVTAGTAGAWQFAVDGDDDVDVVVDGVVVATFYGCHADCNCQTHAGTINLAAGWHRLNAFCNEEGGSEGVKVWYKKPGDPAWTIFGNTLNLRAPDVTLDTRCAIMTIGYIENGTPTAPVTLNLGGVDKRHLFCNTTLSDGGDPIFRFLSNRQERVAQWASKERPVCDTSLGAPTDYIVRVKSCDSSLPFTDSEKDRCKIYPAGNYKPTGILQKYGETDGSKVCSNSLSFCTTDADCGGAPYKCLYKSKIYFGLMTGSYEKNISGGVLRKNISSFTDEIDTFNGIFIAAAEKIYQNINNIKITQFDYGSKAYSGGWISQPMTEGQFESWGNPVGEMMYEATRYFAGRPTTTADYYTTGGTDGALGLSNPAWQKPYDMFPHCSKPFIMTISDINNSFDSNQLPGGSFGSIAGDLAGINVTTIANAIGTTENITGNYYIGDVGGATDNVCSSKNITNIGNIRGLCPEEPTKQGSYYPAAVASYGKNTMLSNMAASTSSNSTIETYAVAVSSPSPDFSIKIGNSFIRLVPTAKSVSGSYSFNTNCANKCTLTNSYVTPPATYPYLNISNCVAGAFCATNQIVDYYVRELQYDASNNLIYAKFAINFEDVEQGADHDMDAIVTYEVIPDPINGQVKIKLASEYASGSIDQVIGFNISGTTEDGLYLAVKDRDVSAADGDTPATVANLGLAWEKTFTASGSAAGQLTEPLFYAAKWGGYEDSNGNGIPDGAEWDSYNNFTGSLGSDGIPDNYFKVINPLLMEQQLDRAFSSILKRAAAGSSVASIAEKATKGNLLSQAIFYPEKEIVQTSGIPSILKWFSYLNFYWYFNTRSAQNIRDDFRHNFILDVYNTVGAHDYDRILNFRIDSSGKLLIDYNASNADGTSAGVLGTYQSLDDITKLMESGSLLHTQKSGAVRNIGGVDEFTTVFFGGTGNFIDGNAGSFDSIFGIDTSLPVCLADNPADRYAGLIRYIRGEDDGNATNPAKKCRNRTVNGNIWKLGDIIYSTPKIVDTNSTSYVFVGSNDGMLHVFRSGYLQKQTTKTQPVQLCDDNNPAHCPGNTPPLGTLGDEIWTFIPKNTMPYLRYFADPGYCHIYSVDLAPYIVEYYTDPVKKTGLTSRYLIGGMRLGGACGCTNSTTCVKPPLDTCPDPALDTCVGRSSYFAIDITDPEHPIFKWEFSHKDLGFSFSGPAVIRYAGNSPATTNVVFGSGPTNYEGDIGQQLKLFAFNLESGPGAANINVKEISTFGSLLSVINNSFTGRFFTDGFNKDKDNFGTAEYFAFGYSQKDPGWKGGVVWVDTTNSNPTNWSTHIYSLSGINFKPITAKVEYMDCFNYPYMYFASGRWFYKTDNVNPSDQDALFGVPIDCAGGPCVPNDGTGTPTVQDATTVAGAAAACSALGSARFPWYLNLYNTHFALGYLVERAITDPAKSGFDSIFFTTMEPTTDVCGFGGRSRIWGLNCATGGSIFATCGTFTPKVPAGASLLLQLSGGNIKDVKIAPPAEGGAFTQEGDRATEWFPGTPPESAPPLSTPATAPQIILWMER